MDQFYYVSLDLHKKTIAFCIKTASGSIINQGTIAAERAALRQWGSGLHKPWIGIMEATIFTGWVYDCLKPYAQELKVADPEMLRPSRQPRKRMIKPMLWHLFRHSLFSADVA